MMKQRRDDSTLPFEKQTKFIEFPSIKMNYLSAS